MTVFPGFFSFFSTFIPQMPFGKTRVRPPPNQKLLITQQKSSRTIAVSNAHLWATINSFCPEDAISDSPSWPSIPERPHFGAILGHFGAILGAFWGKIHYFGRLKPHFGAQKRAARRAKRAPHHACCTLVGRIFDLENGFAKILIHNGCHLKALAQKHGNKEKLRCRHHMIPARTCYDPILRF